MFNKLLSKIYSFALNIVFMLLIASRLLAAGDPVTGEITVSGTVTLNGEAVISSTTIASGNVIETNTKSTATVSLGKIGKVELSESSKLTLNFTEKGMDGFLSHGEAKFLTPAGLTAEFTTKDVTVVADQSRSNSFRLTVECAHTHVENYAGLIIMRLDHSEKSVDAGEERIAGDISKAECPVCPVAFKKKKPGLLPGLFGSGLAGIIAAIVGGGGGSDPEGPPFDISPIRPR